MLYFSHISALFTCLWTTDFGKVDPKSHSAIIVTVPSLALPMEHSKEGSFSFNEESSERTRTLDSSFLNYRSGSIAARP